MRKKYIFGKKLYISVLTSILVLLTTVATTFAWVGVFANSTFDTFDVNLKASGLEEYGIEISLTGEEGSFSDSVNSIDLKKQILLNWGYSEAELSSNNIIENLFSLLEMDQCTTLPNISGNNIQSLGKFYDMFGVETNKYFKFDLYISATKFYDSHDASTYNLDVFLNNDIMIGTKKNRSLFKPFTYPLSFENPYNQMIDDGTIKLPEGVEPLNGGYRFYSATLDSSTTTRVAFEKYKVVDKYAVGQYTTIDQPISTNIYQKGYDFPVYDTINNIYDFGGILPDEINFSTAYYNSCESKYMSHNYKMISISPEIYNARGVESNTKDIIISSKTNQLIDSTNSNEQISVEKMMKMTIYFWFEGWDADCFKAVGGSPVTLNIELSISNEEL